VQKLRHKKLIKLTPGKSLKTNDLIKKKKMRVEEENIKKNYE
jgi:hypothetical protein